MRPFHKDYGLTDACRIRAATDAQLFGVPKAAKLNKLGQTTVRQYCERLEFQPLILKVRRNK